LGAALQDRFDVIVQRQSSVDLGTAMGQTDAPGKLCLSSSSFRNLPLYFFHIGVGSEPSNHVAMVIPNRINAGQKPAERAVSTPYRELHFKRFTRADGMLPSFND